MLQPDREERPSALGSRILRANLALSKAVALVGEGRQLIGSYMGSSVPMRDLPCYVKLYRAGLLPIDHLVTSTLPLDQINEGFDELDSGKQARQIPQFG